MRVTVRSNTDQIVKGLAAKVKRSQEDLGFVVGSALALTADRIKDKGFVPKGKRIPAKDVYFNGRGKRHRAYSKALPVERTGETKREFDVVSGAEHKANYSLHIGDGTVRAEVSRVAGRVRAIFRSNSAKLGALENRPPVNGKNSNARRFINKQWSYVLKTFRKSLAAAYGPAIGAK